MAATDDFKFKQTDYCTGPEREAFRQLRKSGEITFFGTDACAQCGTDVIKGKKYCSIKCKTKHLGREQDDDGSSFE